jgi:CheY-like chemotaxis protein
VRAGKIVRNLLAFVRRSSSERSLQDMNDLLRATLALRAYEFRSANISLHEEYAENLPPVWVNPEEIQQVVLNLILNAEHAMRAAHEGGTLTLRTTMVDAHVVAEVRDDGPGVPAKLTGRVFEPFFSTKGVGEGTGLGLSIALGIAEAHGGILSIVPTASGACFRLSIPGSRPSDSSETPFSVASGSAYRVLVADDEPALRATLQRLLMRRGLSVDLAVDADVVLSLLEAHRYELIFCDVRLPKMGGFALYSRIADQYGALARSFIFISSDRLDPDAQAFIDRVRVPVLSKPFSADQLDEILARLLVLPTAQ